MTPACLARMRLGARRRVAAASRRAAPLTARGLSTASCAERESHPSASTSSCRAWSPWTSLSPLPLWTVRASDVGGRSVLGPVARGGACNKASAWRGKCEMRLRLSKAVTDCGAGVAVGNTVCDGWPLLHDADVCVMPANNGTLSRTRTYQAEAPGTVTVKTTVTNCLYGPADVDGTTRKRYSCRCQRWARQCRAPRARSVMAGTPGEPSNDHVGWCGRPAVGVAPPWPVRGLH